MTRTGWTGRTGRSSMWLSCVGLLGTLAGVALSAQTTTVISTQSGASQVGEVHVAGPGIAVAGMKMAVSAGGEMERIVKNVPFSAQANTTTTQVLADGNRIQQTSEMTLARDSEGRTRREMSVDKIGPWSTETNGRLVFIRDPVGMVIYELAPDGQHATKRTLFLPSMDTGEDHLIATKHEAEMRARTKIAAEHSQVIHAGSKGVAFGGQPFEFQTMVIGGPEDDGAVKKETLGEQTVEGVRAQGTRETRTIAAGKIGNERPIEIVSETWYSPDLQMVVSSRHSDPRVGETTYRLTNIVLTEPEASLFQLPAGITVQEDRFILRMDKKKLDDEQPQPQRPDLP